MRNHFALFAKDMYIHPASTVANAIDVSMVSIIIADGLIIVLAGKITRIHIYIYIYRLFICLICSLFWVSFLLVSIGIASIYCYHKKKKEFKDNLQEVNIYTNLILILIVLCFQNK